ncbi:S8 family peptidase [Capnocytophaga canimorsus]|uniref:S8 family peptidase n=1 Tax=Capnocytophaga canimorsus TaxID=28188 RepID=UPI003859DBFD
MLLLKTTEIKNFSLLRWEKEFVVRNYNKIAALLQIHLAKLGVNHKNLLAQPSFIGEGVNERIEWVTNLFATTPKPLTSLEGDERQHYEDLLEEIMAKCAEELPKLDVKIADILRIAITFYSKHNIYCADNKVVMVEWGMKPKTRAEITTLSMYTPQKKDKKIPELEQPLLEYKEEKLQHFQKEDKPVVSNDTIIEEKKDIPAKKASVTTNETNVTSPKQKKSWLKWIIPLLLLLLLSLLLFRSCGGETVERTPQPLPENVTETPPPFREEHLEESQDGMTTVVNDRLIIFITENDKTVEGFIKDFRQEYPDTEKYRFTNADTTITRVMLLLPKEERLQMKENLSNQFPNYGLVVIPETIYQGTYKTNDPALNDHQKSWYFDMCSIYDAWDITMGDESVVVAVIDGGFDVKHPELEGQVIDTYNAITKGTQVNLSDYKNVFHGTHVAATIVGKADNGRGSVGVAPKSKIVAIQVANNDGLIPTSAIVDAVSYAIRKKVDVINMSLGTDFLPIMKMLSIAQQRNLIRNFMKDEEAMWRAMFNWAHKEKIVVVLASGNNDVLIGVDPMNRNQNTIKVSAVQPNRNKALFSNFGENSDISAPGVKIFNAAPNGRYEFADGTSMAAPIVAGAVALLKSKDKTLTSLQVIDLLRKTGIPPLSTEIGPIVNFKKMFEQFENAQQQCDENIKKRYEELKKELEKLEREYADCLQSVDTLTLPKDLKLGDLQGRWMSTTKIFNQSNEELTLYFDFNGSSQGVFSVVEPNKTAFTAPLHIRVEDNKVYMRQLSSAKNPAHKKEYQEYDFEMKPNLSKGRRADCKATDKSNVLNKFRFNLLKMTN